MNQKAVLAILVALLLAFYGCAAKQEQPPREAQAPKIVATIFPLYDFARAVLGTEENITLLIRPGTEIHSFDPTPADILAIEECDIFLYIGGESDEWARDILESLAMEGKTVLRLMDDVQLVSEDGGSEYDEHIWTSPKNAEKMLGAISEAICQADPAGEEGYSARCAAYMEQLALLDEQFRRVVEHAGSKTLVVADRFPFRYFVEEYGLSWHAAFGGCSAETDASAGVVISLIDTVKEQQLPAVFYLEMSNQNVSKIVAEQTGVKQLLLHSCHTISPEDFLENKTYVALMEQNVKNLEEGLG